MQVNRIIADLPVADLDVSRRFYSQLFGLDLEEFNLGWVARFTSPDTGAHLQVVTRDATAPEAPIVSVLSPDVDAPPGRAPCSSTVTSRPCAARWIAATRPLCPAPTTSTRVIPRLYPGRPVQ